MSTVTRRAASGKIPGAWQDEYSGSWHIPEEAIAADPETATTEK